MKSWTAAIWVAVLCILSAADHIRAEHEEDHRYTIWGYVKDNHDTPTQNALVAVVDSQGKRLKVTRSNAKGRYSMRLHMHNNDLGRLLTVETQNVSHQIRVAFDPDDTSSPRKHRIDFLGSQALEHLPSQRSFTPYVWLALGAVVILVPASLYIANRGKSKIRPTSGKGQKAAKRQVRRRSRKRR